jgi:polyferredoxin/formate hydrogenlyase subunit 6/NADH:ubiquinone oxidoreductase subunit I
MRILTVRRISQIFFLVLFLWFCIVSSLGEKWWQLRGWPVNWLLQLDPLIALGTMLTTRALYAGLVWATATVIFTILLGRFFCGWVCPFGSLHHFVGFLGKRGKSLRDRIAVNQYRRGQSIKYYLLVFVLTSAAGSLIAYLIRVSVARPMIVWILVIAGLAVISLFAILKLISNPLKAAIVLLLLVGVWMGLGFFLPLDRAIATSLQTGVLDPIALLHRSVNLVLLPVVDSGIQRLSVSQRYYEGAWLIGAIFLATVFLNLRIPRFYCRFICPLGALLGVLGRFALWRIGKTRGECANCRHCDSDCEGACQPSGRIRISECVLCMNCRSSCEEGLIGYRTSPSASGEIASPNISRRGFVITLVSGAVAIPTLRLTGKAGPNWHPRVIRPPGALAEKDFLARCLRCGQCMRICPTNIIQPAGMEGGLEGLWTPILNFRIGTSGCQLNCIACGQICPSAAIRPISLDEKLGRNEYASAGPVVLGTAFVDRGRCLPWAMDRPCIVCQENCPTSPKAIFTREDFSTVRGGVLSVKKADTLTVEFEGNPLQPGRFATGDYYCKVATAAVDHRRRIVDNTANTLTIASSRPWQRPPPPQSFVHIQVRLQLPFVDLKLCIGCGICEHECPVRVKRAIRVTSENESRGTERSLLLPMAGRNQ